MWQDFTDYILNEVGESDVRIAEIGVGKFDGIAKSLDEKENITIIKIIGAYSTNFSIYKSSVMQNPMGLSTSQVGATACRSCPSSSLPAGISQLWALRFTYTRIRLPA